MNSVVCPNCHKEFELNQALKHQIEEDVLKEEREKNKEHLEKITKELERKAEQRIKDELDFKLKNSENEIKEEREKNKELNEQLLEINKIKRELERKDEQREIEMQKKLSEEREALKEQIGKTLKEKSDIEVAEIKKKLEDTQKALEVAQRKADQKSQQLQGEVLELELEELLRTSFPHDEIEPVGKGITGADIRHIVKSPKGFNCGTILWEFKRTKDWKDAWLVKLKDDVRAEKANIPVIVSAVLPKEIETGFGLKDGVWICDQSLVLPLAMVLRKNLLDVGFQKLVSANRGEKADLLYSYITSHEFQQQVENIVEVYRDMQQQVAKERAAFEKIWKMREAQVQKLLHGTANIVGSMQGLAGASMPQIKGLDLLDEGDNQKSLLD